MYYEALHLFGVAYYYCVCETHPYPLHSKSKYTRILITLYIYINIHHTSGCQKDIDNPYICLFKPHPQVSPFTVHLSLSPGLTFSMSWKCHWNNTYTSSLRNSLSSWLSNNLNGDSANSAGLDICNLMSGFPTPRKACRECSDHLGVNNGCKRTSNKSIPHVDVSKNDPSIKKRSLQIIKKSVLIPKWYFLRCHLSICGHTKCCAPLREFIDYSFPSNSTASLQLQSWGYICLRRMPHQACSSGDASTIRPRSQGHQSHPVSASIQNWFRFFQPLCRQPPKHVRFARDKLSHWTSLNHALWSLAFFAERNGPASSQCL